MAYVPGHAYDVFVSYAHVDNRPYAEVDTGWVTILVKNLETLLARKLGRPDASLWMDHDLAGNAPLTPAILEALHQTATLVVVLSPGYLASEWCRREREAFLTIVRERIDAGMRVFLVETDAVEPLERPIELRDLLGYRFWVADREGKPPRTLGMPIPSLSDREYYDRLNDLSHDLAAELRRLKEAPAANAPLFPAGPSDAGQVVLLAEVTDDLDSHREEVKRYLTQAGLSLLPETLYPRDDPAAFREAVDRDLARSKLFVQLLSTVSGKKPANLPQGFAVLQYERAAAAGKPVLQWRSRDLDLTRIADAAHRSLLERETVRVVGIEEFKLAVVEEAQREPPPLPHSPVEAFVFVNTDSNDRGQGEAIGKALLKHGIGYALPLSQGKPAEIRQDLEENVRGCDALFFVYGLTTPTWIRSQLLQCRKILSRRDEPLEALVIYEGPPPEKEELAFQLPNMRVLNCRSGLNESVLKEFLIALRAGGKMWQEHRMAS